MDNFDFDGLDLGVQRPPVQWVVQCAAPPIVVRPKAKRQGSGMPFAANVLVSNLALSAIITYPCSIRSKQAFSSYVTGGC